MAYLIKNKESDAVALMDGGNFIGVTRDSFPALADRFGAPIVVSETQFAKFQRAG